MRKILFTMILSMAVITASFHAQVKRFVILERKTNKNIHLAIAKNNYNSLAYKYCEARLDYTIVKIRGSRADTLLQKQLPAFKLKELSSFARVFKENIEIKDVHERKERIIINYTVTYSSKGSELKVEHEKLVPKGVTSDSLDISI